MKQSFYGNLRAQGYDIGTNPAEIIDFYLQAWDQLGRPRPVLEPMCGTGLNLIPFLNADADCDGVDSSPYMLAICRRKLDDLGLTCALYEQYLEKMNLPRQYGFMFIPDRSYSHIYDKTTAAEVLRRLYEHLLPGGWLVFDVRHSSTIDEFGKSGQVDHDLEELHDGSVLFTTGYWDHLEDGRVIRNWNKMERFVDDVLTDTEIFDYHERLYEIQELESELNLAGFQTVRVTKAYEYGAEPQGRDGMVFFCRKQ